MVFAFFYCLTLFGTLGFGVWALVSNAVSDTRARDFLTGVRREVVAMGASGLSPDEIAERVNASTEIRIKREHVRAAVTRWSTEVAEAAAFRKSCQDVLNGPAPEQAPGSEHATGVA